MSEITDVISQRNVVDLVTVSVIHQKTLIDIIEIIVSLEVEVIGHELLGRQIKYITVIVHSLIIHVGSLID